MTRRKIGCVSGLVALAVVAMFPAAAFATWSSYNIDGTNTYGIREGNNYIALGVTQKEATKTAHKVNKALAKDKGFVDPGSGPCHTGALC